MATVGVLAYQGDVPKHFSVLEALGATPTRVRDPKDLSRIDGLIIPGGESTTIGLLLERFGTGEAIRSAGCDGLPIFGTCAGAILLAKSIVDSTQYRLALMDTVVARNAYGRQIDSFEARFPIRPLGIETALGVFIRAPVITGVEAKVEVLAEYDGAPVLVRQESLLAATFHPELTHDTRLHRYFLSTL